ncbi:MAG: Cna B-type domain-containing protein [Oscillospiraceae bacterium]|nr:Cna B-type domain-containing protein [Oscillospiraceae bacterium]
MKKHTKSGRKPFSRTLAATLAVVLMLSFAATALSSSGLVPEDEVTDAAVTDTANTGDAAGPSEEPPSDPTDAPEPTDVPAAEVTDEPADEPAGDPSEVPPTEEPGDEPGDAPTPDPDAAPSAEPSEEPDALPEEAEEDLPLLTAGAPTLTLSAVTTNGSAPLPQPWDYVSAYTYTTVISGDPDGTGTGRVITLTAPAGMRFNLGAVAGKPGITIKYTTTYAWNTANYGKEIQFILDDGFNDSFLFQIPVLAAGANTGNATTNSAPAAAQANTALSVGNVIYNWGYAGNTTAPKSTTTATATGSWGGTVPGAALEMDYAIFNKDVFTGLYLSGESGALYTAATITGDGQIVYYARVHSSGSMYYNTTTADYNAWLFYTDQTSVKHVPFWNLTVKVYIPDGLRVSNTALASLVQNDGDGKGSYIRVENCNLSAPITNSYAVTRMKSPVGGARITGGNNGTYGIYGSSAHYAANNLFGPTYALNLALALDEPISNGKVYTAPDTEYEYDTYDENGDLEHVVKTLNPVRITTPNLKGIDAYAITAGTADAATEKLQYATITLKNQYTYNHANYNGLNKNDQHVGGTLTFEADPAAYSLQEMRVTAAVAANQFWARGGASGSGVPATANGVQVLNALRSGLPASTVVEYELEDGLTYTANKTITPLTSYLPLVAGDPLCQILIDDGGFISVVDFPDATDTNRVVKVTFTLTKGLNLASAFYYNFRYSYIADAGLPDNAPSEGSGVHRTQMAILLTEPGGCTFRDGAAADSSPVITDGAHSQIQTIYIRSTLDLLLMQTRGIYMSNSHTEAGIQAGINNTGVQEVPFLNGGTGNTARSATIAFAYGFVGDSTNYTAKQGAWPVYYDFEMAIKTDTEAQRRYLETVKSFDVLATMFTNAKIEYTTNLSGGVQTLTLGSTTSYPPTGSALIGATTSSFGTKTFSLAADEYLTSFVLKADEFKAGAVYWRNTSPVGTNPVGSLYPTQGYWGVNDDGSYRGSGIVFYSHQTRNFRSDGTPIPDAYAEYAATLATFDLQTRFSGRIDPLSPDRIAEKSSFSSAGVTFPIVFRRTAAVTLMISNDAHGYSFAPYNNGSEYTTAAIPVQVAQGSTFSMPISLGVGYAYIRSAGSQVNRYNTITWMKVNPNFSYVGTDPKVHVVTASDGATWLWIEEDPVNHNITGQAAFVAYLSMLALPTASVGTTRVVDELYRTLDTREQYDRNWGMTNAAAGYTYNITLPPLVPDILELYNGNNGNGTGSIRAVAGYPATTNILKAFTSGVTLLSGVGSSYSAVDANAMWREPQSSSLVVQAAIGGGSSVPVADYEVIFHLPQNGETVSHTPKNEGPTDTVVDYGLHLRGAINDSQAGSIPHTVEYKIGGTWYAQAAVDANGGWSAVTNVKVFFPSYPPETTVGIILPVAPDESARALTPGDLSAVTATYSWGGEPANRTNAARFLLEKYRIASTSATAGYAFNDTNNNNLFVNNAGQGEIKRAGMPVELWAADSTGVPLGAAPVATTATKSDGTWEFTGQNSDYYVVKYVLPEGYRFAAKGANTTANASHVDTATGLTDLINATGVVDMTSSRNAGVQASPLVKVKFVLKNGDEGTENEIVVSSTQYAGIIGNNICTPGTTAGVNVPTHYHLSSGEPASRNKVLSFADPVASFVWLVEGDPITITYIGNSGATPAPGSVTTYNETVPYAPSTLQNNRFERTGYNFIGWAMTSTGAVAYLNQSAFANWESEIAWNGTAGSVTFYAKWEANGVALKIEHIDVDVPTDKVIADQSVTTGHHDDDVTEYYVTNRALQLDPTAIYYPCDSLGNLLPAARIADGRSITLDETEGNPNVLTLYYKRAFTVTFDATYGEFPLAAATDTVEVLRNNKVAAAQAATEEGKLTAPDDAYFAHWSATTSPSGGPVDFSLTADVTASGTVYYAIWNVKYTVLYIDEDTGAVITDETDAYTGYAGQSAQKTASVPAGYRLADGQNATETLAALDTVKANNVITFYLKELTSVAGKKVWIHGENDRSKWPSSVTVNLLADGTAADSQSVTDATENANGEWEFEFTDVDLRDDLGNIIDYTVSEDTVTPYNAAYDQATHTITNTYDAQEVLIEGHKTWDYGIASPSERPTEITVVALANGVIADTLVVTEADGWDYNFVLPRYDAEHKLIVYTIDELDVAHYVKTVTGTDILNTFDPDSVTVTISGHKTWDYGTAPESARPEKLTVQVYEGDRLAAQKDVTAADNWDYAFELPKYDAGGKEIVYRVDEASVPGYTKELFGYNLKNTYDPTTNETVTIKGAKTWKHGANPAENRPTSIQICLMVGDTIIAEKKVTEAQSWGWTFTAAKYGEDGKEIQYRIYERWLPNYDRRVSGWNVTNTWNNGSPKTGDMSRILPWIAIMAASAAGAVWVLAPWKRRSRDDDAEPQD